MLIVSGSLGQCFVPRVYHRVQISTIYVFCASRSRHEPWAKKYTKIKGVFERIPDLFQVLVEDKQKFEKDLLSQQIVDSVVKLFPQLPKFDQPFDIKNLNQDDDHQPQESRKKSIPHTTVSSNQEPEINATIDYSSNVTPYSPYRQRMEFADTGNSILVNPL